MKKEGIAIITLFIIIFVFIIRDYLYSLTAYGSNLDISTEQVNVDSTLSDMDIVYADLGEGISIGNSLDACDWTYFGTLYSAKFQAALIYNSVPWTGWDASEYRYFDNEGCITLSWTISSLNSDATSKASNISIQLVNHNKEYEGTNITCKVKNFSITLKDGRIFQDNDNYTGQHVLEFSNDVTPYIVLDIGQYGLVSSDLIGATVSAELEISDFYRNISGQNASLEQSWGNPTISEALIKAIKKAGFKTVRIPVTYFNHISSNGTIDKEFLDRVEQVVDWVLQNDMYCIIDVHHDTGNAGWIMSSEDSYEKNKEIVGYLFKQIAERFKNKNKHLVLEGLNETVNDETQWFNIPEKDLFVMNKWNQLFVDSVRSTDGRNKDRYLLVNTYAALPLEECLQAFELPKDSVENRIFVGIHCYFYEKNMDSGFGVVEKYSKKFHFIIGEWAISPRKENGPALVEHFIQYTNKLAIPQIVWDDGGGYGLFDRTTTEEYYPEIIDLIFERDN